RHGFSLIRRKGRYVNKSCDLWMVAGFSNYHAAVRMTDEDYGTCLCFDNPPGCGNIVVKRGRRILNNRYRVAVVLQDFVDLFPTRTVHETAVDKDNGPCL